MTDPLYCTFEDVAAATDIHASAQSTKRTLEAIDSVSRDIEYLTGLRKFYPTVATRYYDWPSHRQTGPSWMLRLDDDLLSLTSLTAGGTTIDTGDVFLEPDRTGPPYTRVEIDLSTSAVFDSGDTHQRAIVVVGVWGQCNTTSAATTLGEDLDSSETGVDVASSVDTGTGDTILVGSEYMLITGRTMADTGVDIDTGGDMTATMSSTTLTVDTATGIPQIGEKILIGSERMLVVDAAGTTLTVKRARDGSTLAAHAAGASIYAPRTLTVTRGALGTTAATHTTDDIVYRHEVPGLVHDLAVAETIIKLGHEASGYASTVGGGDTDRTISIAAVRDLRDKVEHAYRRYPRWGSAI
jgi:uncharacterized Zn-binding protein involved in type VI secretion